MKNVPLDRDLVLYLLDKVLPVAADFEAFLLDFFPLAFRRRTTSMDRAAVTELLLSLATPEEITAALAAIEPTRYQAALLHAAEAASIPAPRRTPAAGAAAALPVTSPPPAASGHPMISEPSRAQTRALLNELLITQSDLNAFLLDYFPLVYRQLTPGMERMDRENLLLVHVGTGEIVLALRSLFPKQVQAFLLRLP